MRKSVKILSLLLAMLLVLSLTAISASAYTVPDGYEIADTDDETTINGEIFGRIGDADLNDKVNVKDATMIQKHVALLVNLDKTQLILADSNLDGRINVKDATAIQKWVAGMETGLPIGELIYAPAVTTAPVVTTSGETETTNMTEEPVATTESSASTATTVSTSGTDASETAFVTDATESTSATEITTATDPIEDTTVVITVKDMTSKGWMANNADEREIILIDNDTDTTYIMTSSDGYKTWTATVPSGVKDITFKRVRTSDNVDRNIWIAGDRGTATVWCVLDQDHNEPDTAGKGYWENKTDPVVTDPVVTDPSETDPVEGDTVVITVKDMTSKGWMANNADEREIILIDNDTDTTYIMTSSDGYKTWTATVPSGVKDITFKRVRTSDNVDRNIWNAGDRGTATVWCVLDQDHNEPDTAGKGYWENKTDPVVTDPVVTDPSETDPVEGDTVVITVKDMTSKGWMANNADEREIILIDNDTDTTYIMTSSDGYKTWTATVPSGVKDITFKRVRTSDNVDRNIWVAGNRGTATVWCVLDQDPNEPDTAGKGYWENKTDPVVTDPVVTDPSETDPSETDPSETDPVEGDTVVITVKDMTSKGWMANSANEREIMLIDNDTDTTYIMTSSDGYKTWTATVPSGVKDITFKRVRTSDNVDRNIWIAGDRGTATVWCVLDQDPNEPDTAGKGYWENKTDPVVTDPVVTDPSETDPVEGDTVVITVKDMTSKGWMANSANEREIILIDNDTDTTYIMTSSDGYKTWTATVPSGVKDITFKRVRTSDNVDRNIWITGDRGTATVWCVLDQDSNEPDTAGKGYWEDEISDPITPPTETEDTITVYFTNNKGWDKVNIHYWGGSDKSSWPGVEMNYAKTNGSGQEIFSYVIPKDTTGIVFNNGSGGSSNQTVDIKSDISDGIGFYLDAQIKEDGNSDYNKWTVMTYTFV